MVRHCNKYIEKRKYILFLKYFDIILFWITTLSVSGLEYYSDLLSAQNKGNWLFTTDFCFLKIPFDRVLRNYIEVPDSLMVPSDSPNGFLATQE